MARDTEHLFTSLFFNYIFSLLKFLFISFAHFLLEFFYFLLSKGMPCTPSSSPVWETHPFPTRPSPPGSVRALNIPRLVDDSISFWFALPWWLVRFISLMSLLLCISLSYSLPIVLLGYLSFLVDSSFYCFLIFVICVHIFALIDIFLYIILIFFDLILAWYIFSIPYLTIFCVPLNPHISTSCFWFGTTSATSNSYRALKLCTPLTLWRHSIKHM